MASCHLNARLRLEVKRYEGVFERYGKEPMTGTKTVNATQMASGQSGVVVDIEGGRGFVGRLEALGIRPGKKIRKVSAAFMRGPLIVQVDRCEIAIGFGMARRILVQID